MRELRVFAAQCDRCFKVSSPIFAERKPSMDQLAGWTVTKHPGTGHPAVPYSDSTILCPECSAAPRDSQVDRKDTL